MPQLNEYVVLMKARMNYTQIVAITAEEDDGGFASLGLMAFSLIEVHDFKFVKGVMEKFEGFRGKAIAGSLNSEDIAKFSESLKTLTGKMPWRVSLAFRQACWDSGAQKFNADVLVDDMYGDLKVLLQAVKAEAMLLYAVQSAISKRQPLPLPNMDMLSSLAGLEYDIRVAHLLDSEDELIGAKKMSASASSAMLSLIKKVADAGKDIRNQVQNNMKENYQKVEKEELKKAFDAQRLAAQAANVKKQKQHRCQNR